MQSKEKIAKINLLEMPREILERIFIHLDDDEDLLTASHVCKLFASVVETAFAQKYSSRYYCMDRLKGSFHEVILTKYGEKMRNIKLLNLVEQKCSNLKNVQLGHMSVRPMLKNLKEVSLIHLYGANRASLTRFFNDNYQIEALDIGSMLTNLIGVLDGRLNMLKRLTLRETNSSKYFPQAIRLRLLEILKLGDLRTRTKDSVRFGLSIAIVM